MVCRYGCSSQARQESAYLRISAIFKLRTPTCFGDICNLLEIINQLGQVFSEFSQQDKPLLDIVSKNSHCGWDELQQPKTSNMKPVRAQYSHCSVRTELQPSLQTPHPMAWEPSCYRSRRMERSYQSHMLLDLTPTEQRSVQIEKEALAITWSCDRFADHLPGGVGIPGGNGSQNVWMNYHLECSDSE